MRHSELQLCHKMCETKTIFMDFSQSSFTFYFGMSMFWGFWHHHSHHALGDVNMDRIHWVSQLAVGYTWALKLWAVWSYYRHSQTSVWFIHVWSGEVTCQTSTLFCAHVVNTFDSPLAKMILRYKTLQKTLTLLRDGGEDRSPGRGRRWRIDLPGF